MGVLRYLTTISSFSGMAEDTVSSEIVHSDGDRRFTKTVFDFLFSLFSSTSGVGTGGATSGPAAPQHDTSPNTNFISVTAKKEKKRKRMCAIILKARFVSE